MNQTGKGAQLLDHLALGINNFLGATMERAFGPRVHAGLLGPLSWIDLGMFVLMVLAVLLFNASLAALLRRKLRHPDPKSKWTGWRAEVQAAVRKPVYLCVWVFGLYVAITPVLLKLPSTREAQMVHAGLDKVVSLALFLVLLWAFFRLARWLEGRMAKWAAGTQSKLDDLLVPLLARSLRVIVPILGILLALPIIGLPQEYAGVIAQGSSILVICAISWILAQVVRVGEQAVLAKYDITAADNLRARKVYTQVHVLSKTLYVIIAIFTVASVLMLFQEVRQFGTSLLASAGVVGVVAGFAAQRTIANLFAGFQVAMTQPIRLDDVVIVEGEWGRIEEITLTYVVVHIWDERRLIVPLSYFIEKPFQNWTRVSAALLGSVFLWTDYTLPLEQVRQAVREIIEKSPLWDRRFWNLQVTDTSERAMQIRVLATAVDSGKAWDLRCEIREKLISYLQGHCLEHLPRLRADLSGPNLQPGLAPEKLERRVTE